MNRSRASQTPLAMLLGLVLSAAVSTTFAAPSSPLVKRTILISVDGMHAVDLANYVKARPDSILAVLSQRGVTYTAARTPLLGDSTPGLVSLATGGSPAVTGLPYSPFYDRALSPPGSDCAIKGSVYYLDEKWVKDNLREDSGGGIDTNKLPRDPAANCQPVLPRKLMRVNTIFEVVKASGGRTAWIDQHDMYNDLLEGPSGKGLDDSRSLERKGAPGTLEGTTGQDGRRVQLLLNQIRGFDSYGKRKVGVPMMFGMGFISFGVMQKSDGYSDGEATAGKGTRAALDFIDANLGMIINTLKAEKLYDSTMIVISAKHGQSPIDPRKRRVVDRNVIREAVTSVAPDLLAHASLDTIGLLWLRDASRTSAVVSALRERATVAGIQKIYVGEQLGLLLPLGDSRTPDVLLQPELGVFWADGLDTPATKALMAEHGGMLDEDTNVPLLFSFKGARGVVIRSGVQTSQVAPTVLAAMGLNPQKLKAVQLEGTAVLQGVVAGR